MVDGAETAVGAVVFAAVVGADEEVVTAGLATTLEDDVTAGRGLTTGAGVDTDLVVALEVDVTAALGLAAGTGVDTGLVTVEVVTGCGLTAGEGDAVGLGDALTAGLGDALTAGLGDALTAGLAVTVEEEAVEVLIVDVGLAVELAVVVMAAVGLGLATGDGELAGMTVVTGLGEPVAAGTTILAAGADTWAEVP